MSDHWSLFPNCIFVLTLLAGIGWPPESYAASVSLQWTDTSANETGFKIERMAGTGSYTQIATVSTNVQSYTDTGLTSGTTYCYRVRAFNSAGDSAPSNAGCTTAPTTATTSTPPSSTGSSTGTTTSSPPTPPSDIIARLGSEWSDYRISMKIRSTDNDCLGVMFRYQDRGNYYRFSWHAEAKYRRLEKLVGGEVKVLAQDAVPHTKGQTYALQIVAQGSSLKVHIDGKTIFSVIDNSFSEGTIALYSFINEGSSFDDVMVEDLTTGKVLLSDNFNDHDHVGWTIVDEGDLYGASNWSAATGALVQSSNIGSANSGQAGSYALFTRGSWQDYRVTLKIRSNDDDELGVLFRFQDNDNYYRFSWHGSNKYRRLVKHEKGIDKVIAQDSVPYIVGTNYSLEIIAQGSSLIVNVDGKPVFSVTDQSFNTGTIAFYSYWNKGSVFDDVLVEELPSKAVLLWDNFNDGKLVGWKIFNEPGAQSGPSAWSVVNGELVQSSNIGTVANSAATFALY